MENIPDAFINGLYDRAALDVITLLYVVVMVAYPMGRYMKVVSMCVTFAVCMMIGQSLALCDVSLSRKAISAIMITAVMVPAVMGVFAAGASPSRVVERIGVLAMGLSGLSYGMMNYGMVKAEWVMVPLYGLGELCGCMLLSLVVMLVARLGEMFSLPRREIVIISCAVCIGLYAEEVWKFLTRLF